MHREEGTISGVVRFEGRGPDAKEYDWSNSDPEPYSRALIDDTPENREMLVQFAVMFDELRDKFFRSFAPDNVGQFLAKVASRPQLKA